jgi:cell wall-associated NlpC family hydrolase
LRLRRAGVACALSALCLGGWAPVRATAQTATTDPSTTAAPPPPTTTTAAPTTTTTTVAPTTTTAAPATTTPTVAPPRATTTTTSAAPAAWTAKVPGPPPPSPAVAATAAAASPADLALASLLDSQIATQSRILDVLAERYDRNQQAVADATAKLAEIDGQISTAETSGANAQAGVSQSEGQLRTVAVDAYVGVGATSPQLSSSLLLAAYERGMANAVSETALGKAFDSIKQLQVAQRQLKHVEQDLNRAKQQAIVVNNAARQAAEQSKADALAAAQQQTQLLATLAKAQGNLGALVTAAQAARAQAAYNRFSTQSGALDFTVYSPLPPVLPQTSAALQIAMDQLGKPYVWGGNGPDNFDCSGLTKWAWSHVGVSIPRVAADQQTWTTPVPISQLAPGDLVFMGSPAHHVGMYIGNGMMVNAPHSGANVSVMSIWWDDLAGFGRVHQP